MRDGKVCDARFGIEVMVNHDAAGAPFGGTADGEQRTDDVAEGPHTGELAVVTHDDEVRGFYDGADVGLVFIVNQDVFSTWNPLEKIRENIRGNDADISCRIAPAKPGSEGGGAADGIAVGTSVAGDDDVLGILQELMP